MRAPYSGILITGASSGIGAALAQHLAGPGCQLGLLGRNRERLSATAAACEAKGASTLLGAFDIRDRVAMAAFVSAFETSRPIDLLVANAGIFDGRHEGEVVETAEVAHRVLETNLLASVDTAHAVLPFMRERRRGAIVLVSSLAALVPLRDAPAYSASKAGLLSYGVALRDALQDDGIRVTVACPGFVNTPMSSAHVGPRPNALAADRAAALIIDGLNRDKDMIGFPLVPYLLTRLSLLVPERLRRRGTRGTGFYVASGTSRP